MCFRAQDRKVKDIWIWLVTCFQLRGVTLVKFSTPFYYKSISPFTCGEHGDYICTLPSTNKLDTIEKGSHWFLLFHV